MKVTKLQLTHFRSSRHCDIDLEPGLNLLVGINGAGKTSILDSMAILLSWAAARLRSANARGRGILETDIHNEKTSSSLEITCQVVEYKEQEITWRLLQTRKGRNPDIISSDPVNGLSSFTALNEWANTIRDRIGPKNELVNVPLFVYYPVNRSVLDIPLRIRKSHTFDLLDAYEGAFTGGANFRDFFEWYRNREDLENERYREAGNLTEDPQLRAVREAINSFLPEFSKISVKRNPLRMEVTKNGEQYSVDQMSDGEKCLFALIGDLARRLAIANPERENPHQGEGIILIDEIDLHLHPNWQRMVVAKLTTTFPNCQFIVSTHSPLVFGEVDAQCIHCLTVDRINGLISIKPKQALGLDASEVLEEQMATKSRNQAVSDDLNTLFQLIDAEEFQKAKALINTLRDRLNGSIPELIRAESLMAMLEPKGERK